MKKLLVTLCIGTFLSFAVGSNVQANFNSDDWVNKDVQLTEAQKEEIATIQKEILANKKILINKYVEFGVIPADKGEKIISKMKKHSEKMAENGYIPHWGKHHKKCKCKEGN